MNIFFFNDTPPTEIYTLSLHDALPISPSRRATVRSTDTVVLPAISSPTDAAICTAAWRQSRSEEHTSELQSRRDLVCRLLLEKKKRITAFYILSAVAPIGLVIDMCIG